MNLKMWTGTEWKYVSQGASGDTGIQGDTGVSDVPGDTGFQGDTGIQGDTGVQGDTGPQGPTGTTTSPMTSEIDLGENAGFILDSALSADGKYSGITIPGTAGASLSFGNLCYLDPTDSRWELANAGVALGANGDARGILGICVLAAAGDGSATKMLLWGRIRAVGWFTFTVNEPVYVADTDGNITNVQPSSTGDVIRVIGWGLSGTDLLFSPSSDYITHI